MPNQPWVSLLNPGAPWQTASGTVLNTAATATISPEGAGGTGADPLVYTLYEGLDLRVRARGVYTNGSTATNGTFALYASASGTAASGGTSLATTGALALPTSVTNLYWEIDALIQCRQWAQGTATPTLYTHGALRIQLATPSGTTGNEQVWPMPATNGPTAADVDTSITHTIALVGTLSQATGSPAITCTNFTIESMN
jgi:hypothetical protein